MKTYVFRYDFIGIGENEDEAFENMKEYTRKFFDDKIRRHSLFKPELLEEYSE